MKTLFENAAQEQLKLTQKRQQQSQTLCRKGLALIERAESEGFTQPATLHQAADALLKALRIFRKNPQPYLSLAYIFMLLQDYPQAIQYVKAVLKQEPQHETALAFKAELLALTQLKRKAEPEAPEENLREQKWLQLEESMTRMVRYMTENALPLPALTPSEREKIKNQLVDYRGRHQKYTRSIADLETDFNLDKQHQQLTALTARIDTLDKIYQISGKFIWIYQSCRKETAFIQNGIKKLKALVDEKKLAGFQKRLEPILDKADLIESRLEDLTQTGYHHEQLEVAFQEYQLAVTLFQDMLDTVEQRFVKTLSAV